jgi:hypothetical protein
MVSNSPRSSSMFYPGNCDWLFYSADKSSAIREISLSIKPSYASSKPYSKSNSMVSSGATATSAARSTGLDGARVGSVLAFFNMTSNQFISSRYRRIACRTTPKIASSFLTVVMKLRSTNDIAQALANSRFATTASGAMRRQRPPLLRSSTGWRSAARSVR